MPSLPPPRRTPNRDRALSPVVTVFLLFAVAAVVAVGVQAWLGLFTAPASADFQVAGCQPGDDVITVRLVDGGPIPYRALGMTLENHTSGETEARIERLPLEGQWNDGRFLRLGSQDPSTTTLPPGEWELASPGGLGNSSAYGLRITESGPKPARPLAALDFHCKG